MISLTFVNYLVVLCICALLLTKAQFKAYTYTFVLVLLMIQLFLVYTDHKLRIERFEEAAGTLETLDSTSAKRLIEIPKVIKTDVNDGIQALIDSTTSEDETSILYEKNVKYADSTVRKQYKHIDYLLEKIRIFNPVIYNTIVPTYSSEQYKAMEEQDKKFMSE
jgi:hypothetical protein